MRTNFIFGHGRIVSTAPKYAPKYALKYAFKNQTAKKEEKKPIAIAVKNEDHIAIPEGYADFAEKTPLVEPGMALAQGTSFPLYHDEQEDMGMTDGIPPMDDADKADDFAFLEDADMGDGFDPLDETDMTGRIEQEGMAQAQHKPVAQSSAVKECEKIYISDEEEQRIEAMFLRDDDNTDMREYKYNYYTVLEDLIKKVEPKDTMKKLKISKKEYLSIVLSIRSVEGKMYEIPKKKPKIRKATIGDNGAIVSQTNIYALGVSHIYPLGSEFISILDKKTGWIMLKPLLSTVS